MAGRSRRLLFGAVLGLCAVAALAGGSASASFPRTALVPNALTFLDPEHGVLATGYQYCASNLHCRPGGTVSLTSDGGRTWRVVLHTPRPVVSVLRFGDGRIVYVRYDDGTTLRSGDGGATWRHARALTSYDSTCPQGMSAGINTQAYGRDDWSICTSEPGAGNQGKSVYRLGARGWVRVAYTPMGTSQRGYGGISTYGYPLGIAGAEDGFGVIWESRGTLYVTRDGGHHWDAQAKVARPEIDFGQWAYVLPRGGDGFVVLARGGACPCRLITTADAGRHWRVVHRWPATQ